MFCAFPGPGPASNSLMYHYGNGKGMYSQCPNAEELKKDSASYSSFKLPNTNFTNSFFDGPNNSTDPWSSSSGISPSGHGGMLGSPSPSQSPPGNYGNLPTQDRLNMLQNSALSEASKRLPPMSTFHRSSGSASLFVSAPHTAPANVIDRPMSGQGNHVGGSHTGDALGKALASIYSPDHTSSSFPSSSSTPGRSPSPLAASTVSAGSNQWPRSTGQPSLPSNYENSLQSLIEDRLDRLDDAIHVLRNHAVGGTNIPLSNDIRSLIGQTQHGSTVTMRSNYPISGLVTNGLPTDVSADSGEAAHLAIQSSASPPDLTSQEDSFRALAVGLLSNLSPGPVEVKMEPSDAEDFTLHRMHPAHLSHLHRSTCLSHPASDGLVSDTESDTREMETSSVDPHTRNSSVHEDEELSPEQKAEREKERRMANNARERLRVRDINEAFKELGRMCQLHLKSDKPQTKLLILHQAVAVILSLEQQVRERNLNPKAACLRRREEEKVSTLSLDPHAMHTVIHTALPDQINSLHGHL
ncbi:transcription factor 12-like [Hoplias malabaricus]|uniref:transcription factor 12-like n=1 Tax=Hoplias malabaricus TaxID=27720 RepID=UPI003462F27A